MTNLQQAQQAYTELQKIEGNAISNVTIFKEMFDEELSKINTDRTLSSEGKEMRRSELIADKGKEFMEFVKKEKDEYQRYVVQARNRAQAALVEPFKKPHDTEIAVHEQRVQELSMDSLFGSPTSSVNSVKQYAESIEDPYIASQFIKDLPAIYDRLTSRGAQTQEIGVLDATYSTLKSKTLTEDRRIAQEIYSSTDGRFSNKLYHGVAEEAIRTRIGTKYSNHLNTPYNFKS